ncbi:hypothetical protein [Vibrio harveyi]|uniref:hypothetical protein n=1 Tax=Vibrio harveyi TaxID=669 RepID=UPI003D702E94
MNPNSPLSYYQVGAVSVTSGSDIVTGYKTEWLTSDKPSKPKIGSIFTIDQANFYTVISIKDDTTIILDQPFIAPTQAKTSYLIIGQMYVDITADDQISIDQVIDAANEAVALAKDWAIKMDAPVEDEEFSSKYNALLSANSAAEAGESADSASDSATASGISADAAAESAAVAAESETNASNDASAAHDSALASEASASASADSALNASNAANAASESAVDADASAGDSAESAAAAAASESNAKASEVLAHDFAVGQNPPPELDTPTDENNCYFYYQRVLDLASGAINFGENFIPSLEKEYPDKTPTSSLWLIQTTDPEGYTFTTGNMRGFTCMSGDWFVYYKTLDLFEVLFVSPLHNASVGPATEEVMGIARLAKEETVIAGTNHTDIVTPLTLASVYVQQTITICGKPLSDNITLAAVDVGARPDTWLPTISDIGAAAAVHTHVWADITDPPAYATRWAAWDEITDKPTEFTPATHTHTWSQITDPPATYAPSAHTHTWSQITDPPATYAPSAHTHAWADITGAPVYTTRWAAWDEVTGKPTTFPPASHTHAWSQITDPPAYATRWAKATEIGAGALPSGVTIGATQVTGNFTAVNSSGDVTAFVGTKSNSLDKQGFVA